MQKLHEYNIQKCKLFDDTFPWATDEQNPVWKANKNKKNNNNQTRMENFVYQTTRTDDVLDMFAEAKMPFSKMDLETHFNIIFSPTQQPSVLSSTFIKSQI